MAQAANGVDALALIDEHAPDLVFLDVQMPGLNGFEVARQVLERQDGTGDRAHGGAHGEDRVEASGGAEIVFVTAFDQYAIEAFQVDAVDYLLKPVDPERLDQAVQRARRRIGRGRPRGRPRRRGTTAGGPSRRWRTPSSRGSSNALPWARDGGNGWR